MTDVFSKKKRSAIMAAIKGRGACSTEVAVRRILKRLGITKWRSHLDSIPGKPDFAFRKIKLAVFVDGCFWHGCKVCTKNRKPATNAAFWRKKIAGNMRRDKRVNRELNLLGWSVLRIWEHSVEKNSDKVANRLAKTIKAKSKE